MSELATKRGKKILQSKVEQASAESDSGLVNKAHRLIRERILKNVLPFGAPISRQAIAKELNMSLLPVSAALQRLQYENLVETAPRSGTRVKIPTPQDIRGFYVVREALESMSARLFAEWAEPRDRAELKQLAIDLDQMYAKCATSIDASEEELFELRSFHMRFHRKIAEVCGCPLLLDAIEKNQILIFNWFYDRLFGRLSLPDHWHRELAEALCDTDPEKADAAMRRHVRFRLERLLQKLEPYLSLSISENPPGR